MFSLDEIKSELAELNELDRENISFPDRQKVKSIIKLVHVVLFPNYYHYLDYSLDEAWSNLIKLLEEEIHVSLNQSSLEEEKLVQSFISSLPKIKKELLTDLQSIYDGDPAAKTKAEILLCYPGFYAISIYRMAHELYALNIPYIPRIMTEFAHEKTGIDINPGATIGEYFCIDHGTGIVIGETAVIGHHVKLYQGVTIGAKSFDLDEYGNPKKSGKRHPNIGNHVVIYANATILGGDTTIGDNSIIGGNTWLIHSVEENSKIYYR